MSQTISLRMILLSISLGLSACSNETRTAQTDIEQNQMLAEKFIDAFYSFDPEQLAPLLAAAGDSKAQMLYYQGWAEGGDYQIIERKACTGETPDKITCPITVQDNPVLALQTGFFVTDTFSISFSDRKIIRVETSSNDQPIYYEARDWVKKEMPEVMTGPCAGFFAGGETPADCARAMTEGYKQFMIARKRASAFIPDTFEPPVLVEADGFKLQPLGPDLVDIDYQAYMSSIEHLQRTFTRNTTWPRADLNAEDALLDMQTEQARFQNRASFAYAVLTPDGSRERGCVYVYPSTKPGYDAVIRLWVTQTEYDAGFDTHLFEWVQTWIESEWPFSTVAFPGRSIDWTEWESLPDHTG